MATPTRPKYLGHQFNPAMRWLPGFLSRPLYYYPQIARRTPGLKSSYLEQQFKLINATLPPNYARSMQQVVGKNYEFNKTLVVIKYADIDYWLRVNIARAFELGLPTEPRKKILDLGCGSGLFLVTCAHYGHDIQGLDLPFADMGPRPRSVFEASSAKLGLNNRIIRMPISSPFELSPEHTCDRFDLITAFMIRFYSVDDVFWSLAEWKIFVEHIKNYLTPTGFCYFKFNPEVNFYPETIYVDHDVTAYFRQIGEFSDGVLKFGREPARAESAPSSNS